MIPLHTTSTTVHVDQAEADRLVAIGAARWIAGQRALIASPM